MTYKKELQKAGVGEEFIAQLDHVIPYNFLIRSNFNTRAFFTRALRPFFLVGHMKWEI